MRRHDLLEKKNATVSREFEEKAKAEQYLEECEDKLLTCHLVQVGNKWKVEIEK